MRGQRARSPAGLGWSSGVCTLALALEPQRGAHGHHGPVPTAIAGTAARGHLLLKSPFLMIL